MKILENKETELEKENGKMDYFDLFRLAVENTSQEGLNIQQVRKRLRVLEALKGNKSKLEDDDFDTLKKCWDAMKWRAVKKDISEADKYLKEINDKKNA